VNIFLLSNRKRDSKGKSLEDELIHLFDRSIHLTRKQQHQAFTPKNDDVTANSLYSTLSELIYLLSRNRQNNSLHMHLIMHLSGEINKFISGNLEEHHRNYLANNAELLLDNCYRIMEVAERKTIEHEEIGYMYWFKDEKRLIKNYKEKPHITD